MVLMSKKIILCITEGARTERNILNSLSRNYLNDKNIEIYHFGASIYELYQSLSADEDLETYRLLQEFVYDRKKQKLNYPRRQIFAIYLFFDFEGHAKQAKNIHQEMLQLFDNETENGKLFFSYPMVESYKHPFNYQQVIPINIKGGYKKWVADICDKKLENLRKLTLDDWNSILIQHLINVNDLINETLTLPTNYTDKDFNQSIIYQNQLKKHIEPNQEILVISPFCLFLLDYLGNPLLEEWKTINPSSLTSPIPP